jgi:hypothetical protein
MNSRNNPCFRNILANRIGCGIPEAWMKQPEKMLYRITNKLYFIKERDNAPHTSSFRSLLEPWAGILIRMKAVSIWGSAAMDMPLPWPIID